MADYLTAHFIGDTLRRPQIAGHAWPPQKSRPEILRQRKETLRLEGRNHGKNFLSPPASNFRSNALKGA